MVVLSILVPVTSSRKEAYQPLRSEIIRQISRTDGKAELIENWNEHLNVGAKRNLLLKDSKGKYVVFIDSDDHISSDYVEKILEASKENKDCIGIHGWITTNGRKSQDWYISKDYGKWYTQDNVHYRTPNHISPVKRSIAMQAMFPEVKFGEDYEYSMRILPLLKTEAQVEGKIYHYDYWKKNKK